MVTAPGWTSSMLRCPSIQGAGKTSWVWSFVRLLVSLSLNFNPFPDGQRRPLIVHSELQLQKPESLIDRPEGQTPSITVGFYFCFSVERLRHEVWGISPAGMCGRSAGKIFKEEKSQPVLLEMSVTAFVTARLCPSELTNIPLLHYLSASVPRVDIWVTATPRFTLKAFPLIPWPPFIQHWCRRRWETIQLFFYSWAQSRPTWDRTRGAAKSQRPSAGPRRAVLYRRSVCGDSVIRLSKHKLI